MPIWDTEKKKKLSKNARPTFMQDGVGLPLVLQNMLLNGSETVEYGTTP